MFDIDQELKELVLFRKDQIKVEENFLRNSTPKSELWRIRVENDHAFNNYIDELINEIEKVKQQDPDMYFGVTYRKLINYISGMKQHRH